MKGKVLVVDDDAAVRDSLGKWFESEGYYAQAAKDAEEALEAVEKERWDIALLDLKMPDVDGIQLQLRLRDVDAELPVVIMTGYASVESAVRTLKNGAHDYIVKPFDPDELVHLVGKTLEHCRTKREVARLRENLRQVTAATDLVGQSPGMRRVNELIDTAAPSDAPVLIAGEPGTGKQMVARTIHARGPRRYMPMVVVHCGALREELATGELFGEEPSTFAEAPNPRKGKFEIGDGGTVFLDEVGELHPKTQAELTRVLVDKQIVRVGGARPVHVEFRCIASCRENLDELVRRHEFSSDLRDCLNFFSIHLPPLRDRKEDIPLLVDFFLRQYAAAMNRPIPKLSKPAVEMLLDHHWPGNVRELENAVERALLITRDDTIEPSDFPFQGELSHNQPTESLAQVERRHIERVVTETNWNLSKSARILGIDRTTLYNKLKRYGLR